MTDKNNSLLTIQNISKRFGENQALTDFSLELAQGTFCCLLGPSGCGKSTALRIISGLDRPDSGTIFIKGQDMTRIPPQQRSVGMVFQNYALFPHMNVADNIAFGIQDQAPEKKKHMIERMLDMVRLNGFEKRSISELSGGEQQRVALARALARNPELLLLDEPFSNLDVRLKESMHKDLFELIQQVGITTILVTHDQEEAMSLADTIVLMNQGKIEQTGTPQQLYCQPNSSFCANFLGRVNLFERDTFLKLFSTTHIMLPEKESSYSFIAIRPESFKLASNDEKGTEFEILRASFHGSFFRYTARPTATSYFDLEIIIEMTADSTSFHAGEYHRFTVEETALHLLPS